MEKLPTQKETAVLKFDLCTACSSKCCEYNIKVVFFPQEVERGLHKIFPFKAITINGWKVHFFEGTCPYFSDGLCELYGTEHMPIDCQIYPVTPISHEAYIIDDKCLLRKKLQNDKQYIRRCMEKIRDTPEDFLKIYKELESLNSKEATPLSKEFLKKKIVPIDIEGIDTISGMLSAFSNTSFQSRNLARCVQIFTRMLEDPDEPTIFLGLAGAMIPAGMKKVVSTMVKRKMVDVIVTTGANAYHDLVESFGHYHYKGSPEVDDAELYQRRIDRIYDTFADEEKYRLVDRKIMALADKIRTENVDVTSISSREFLHELGGLIDEEGLKDEKESSFVWNCWRYNVPIFVPALADSSIGLGLTQHYIKFLKEGLEPLGVDPIKDNYEIFEIKKMAKKTGVIYIGGGVPKNYIQQTAYLEDMFGIADRGHDYGFQITTDRPEWGGLSGCTFREGVSWGKDKHTGEFVTCYCDATIALPLIVKAVLERLETAPAMKRRTER